MKVKGIKERIAEMPYITDMQNNIEKILIVEDNPADARLAKECLKESETRSFLFTKKEK